jgi:hypothetical protein
MSEAERHEDKEDKVKVTLNLTVDAGPHLSHLFKRLFPKREGRPRVVFNRVSFMDGSQVKGDLMGVSISDVQKVSLSISVTDAAGNPAPVDGVPSWSSNDPSNSVVSLAPATDGLTCEVSAVGPLGAAQVTVSADADLGEGVQTITSSPFDVEVVASQATNLGISAGVPEPK